MEKRRPTDLSFIKY